MTGIYEDGRVWQAGHAARHEAGHAAVCVALGVPFTEATIGRLDGQSVVRTLPGALVGTTGVLVLAAGFIADYLAWNRTIRGSQIRKLLTGGRDGTFAVDCAKQGEITFAVGAFIAPGMDFEFIGEHFRGRDDVFIAAQDAVTIWREAEAYVAALRPAIDAIADPLLQWGDIKHHEAAWRATAAMGGRWPRPPEWARSAEELAAL